MTGSKTYNVGISYAYEDEAVVKPVAKALESVGLTVFFDQNEAAQLVGKNLTYILPEIYTNHCEYCLMFVSRSYVGKRWTDYERDWLISKRINSQKDDIFTDCIIPVFIDHVSVPGLNPGIVGFDIKKQSAEEIAHIMYEKITGTEVCIAAGTPSIEAVFNQMLADIENFLTKQDAGSYQIDRLSEHDVVINIRGENQNRFLRLALEGTSHNLLKIAQGDEFIPKQEWIWDAEAYLEKGQLYFINYNLTTEFPGQSHLFSAEKLSASVLQKVYKFIKERLYV